MLPSTTLYYKACTKYSPILLCTTKLARSTSQYYIVQQSLHKARPSTTLYYKACTKHFPVLLCTIKLAQMHVPVLLSTTKFAQGNSQYYFVLQSRTFYCKACTEYFPILICATEIVQSTSQYYCVLLSLRTVLPSSQYYLQGLHRVLPSTTLYY